MLHTDVTFHGKLGHCQEQVRYSKEDNEANVLIHQGQARTWRGQPEMCAKAVITLPVEKTLPMIRQRENPIQSSHHVGFQMGVDSVLAVGQTR